MPDRALHRLLQRVLRRRVRGHFARAVHLLYKDQLNGCWAGRKRYSTREHSGYSARSIQFMCVMSGRQLT